MTTVEYQCKICGRPGSVTVDCEDLPIRAHAWKAMLCHDHCHDYWIERRRIWFLIKKCCEVMIQSRDSRKAAEVQKRAGEKLGDLTKRFAYIVCDFLRKPRTWDAEFVAMLMERPERVDDVLRQFLKHIKSYSAPSNV